jgi:hypothetical protein
MSKMAVLALFLAAGLATSVANAQLLPLSATCLALTGASFPVEYALNSDYIYQQTQYW